MWGVYFVNYSSNFEWKQNNKHFLSSCDMVGVEDKTKRNRTEPHLQGDQCLAGEGGDTKASTAKALKPTGKSPGLCRAAASTRPDTAWLPFEEHWPDRWFSCTAFFFCIISGNDMTIAALLWMDTKRWHSEPVNDNLLVESSAFPRPPPPLSCPRSIQITWDKKKSVWESKLTEGVNWGHGGSQRDRALLT